MSMTFFKAHDRNRTGDLFLTKEVLCRLSYMGISSNCSSRLNGFSCFFTGAGNGIRTRDPQLGRLTLYH